MASYTYNSNIVPSDPNQYFTLNVTFENGVITWNVVPKRQDGETGNVVRNTIYELTVNIGGNSYYKGNINWQDYTVGAVIYSGTTQLASCTVNNGLVAIGLTGNYYYGTWNSTYTCRISTNLVIQSPTVATPTYTATNVYNDDIVGGYSQITFSFSATAGTQGNTISKYRLYQDNVLVYEGTANTCTITAPQGGEHSYYVVAVESNGATGQSSTVSVTTLVYTAPAFISVESVRWSSGLPTGVASDDGEYAKLTATFSKSKVGDDELPTSCKVKVATSVIGTLTASGNSLFTGQILTPDNMYIVTYELYDSVAGSTAYEFTLDTAPIIRNDIITIGGRGIDLIHDTNGYGIGLGKKAVIGFFDTALPARIVEIDSAGNIVKEADIYPEPQTLTVTATKTDSSSTANMTSITVKQWGRVVQMTVHLTNVNYAQAGDVIWAGTISGMPAPVDTATGVGNNGTNHCIGNLFESNGTITLSIRSVFGYQANWTANVSFTFLV